MNPVKGGAISFIGVGLQQLINLGGAIVLARILGPEDFGVYALCFAVFLFFQSFLDFGLTPIYLKYPAVNKLVNSTFLSINVFFGVLVAILVLLISPLMVYYYDLNLLSRLFPIMAISAICMSSSNQPFSQLLRNKKFYSTESISIGSAAISLIISISLALSGWGAMALAIKHLSYSFTRLISALLLSRAKYQLVSLKNILAIKPYIIQAYHLVISRLITGISGNIEKLFVGKIFGEFTLGHYERGLFVVDKPNTFRNALTTPAMSYLSTMKGEPLQQAYKILSLFILNFIGIPCLCFHLFGQDITTLILGDQWISAGSYVVWLAFLGLSLIFKGLTNIMYINDLKTKQLTRLYWIGALTIFTPVIIGLLFIKINMLVFVTLYSILSLAYWFICWCRTILKYVDNHDAWRVIAYVSTLLTTFVIVGELSQRFITFDSFFEILLLLILSWVVAMILTGIIFNSEMQLQKKFIVDRLPNPS
jgi:O-antigen/teichoic acid export membrane protein